MNLKVSLDELIRFIARAIYPESAADLVIYSMVIFILVAGACYKLGGFSPKMRLRKLVPIPFCASVAVIIYLVSFFWIFPTINRFAKSEDGILLANLSGPRLVELIGTSPLNSRIAAEVRMELLELGLDTIVNVRSISWIVTSDKEANYFMRRYCANAILWGTVTKLDKSAEFQLIYNAGSIWIDLKMPGISQAKIGFDLYTKGNFSLYLDNPRYNLNSLVRQIVLDFLPTIATINLYKNPEISIDLIKKLPSLDRTILDHPVAGFLLLGAAEALTRLNREAEAMDVYANSYQHFQKLRMNRQSNRITMPNIDRRKIDRFASFVKLREGYLAWTINDFQRATNCFRLAAESDTTLRAYIEKDCLMLTGLNLSR